MERTLGRGALLAVVLALVACGSAEAAPAVTTTADTGAGSLRAAVAGAAPGDTITVPASAAHYTLGAGAISITQDLTIAGAGAGSTVIEATGPSRIFVVTGGSLTLSGLTLAGGHPGSVGGPNNGGGALLFKSPGSLVVRGCAFRDNAITVTSGAFNGGGALYFGGGGDLTIADSSFTGNTFTATGVTGNNGGGAVLSNHPGTTTVSGSTFSSNAANVTYSGGGDHGGGALSNLGAALNVTGSTFASNTFTVGAGSGGGFTGGGAIFHNSASPITVDATTIRDNGATLPITSPSDHSGGGGMHVEGGALTLQGSTVSGNRVTMTGGAFTNSGGGGVFLNTGSASTVVRSAITANTSETSNAVGTNANGGGGIHSEGPLLSIHSSALDGNTANVTAPGAANSGGGGLFTNTGSPVTLGEASVSGNRTSVGSGGNLNGGGGIYAQGSGPGLTNTTIAANVAAPTSGATHGGGGVLTSFGAPPVTFTNATVSGNATDGTAGVLLLGGGIGLSSTILSGNGAANCAVSGGPGFTSTGHNVESLDTCGLGAGDLKSTDPKLGPPGAHGGPGTTAMLLAGSPALGFGDVCPPTDQRGVLRPLTGCDAGAVQMEKPGVDTGAVTALSNSRVRIDGTVTPSFSLTTFQVDYGTTTAYGASSPASAAGDGGGAVPASVTLSGLRSHTTYHYRLVAANAAGTSAGADVIFTTPFPDPVVSRARFVPTRFRVAPGRTAVSSRVRRVKRGSSLRFSLNESAGVRIRLYAVLAGRRSGRRCVKPTRRLRRARRCTRLLLKGTLTRRNRRAGSNRIAFSGRVGRRRLAPGGYRAIIVATKAGALHASRARTARFTILPGTAARAVSAGAGAPGPASRTSASRSGRPRWREA